MLAVPAIAIKGPGEACVYSTQTFIADITGDLLNLETQWNMGQGASNPTTQAITQTFTAAGAYEVQLQSNYMNYCRDTARYQVAIWPLPNVFAGHDILVWLGTPIQITASGAASYAWQQAPDLSCATNGKSAGTDSYIYMIELVCENAGVVTYKGNVALLRKEYKL